MATGPITNVLASWRRLSATWRAVLVLLLVLGLAAAVLLPILLRDRPTPVEPVVRDPEADTPPEIVVQAIYPGANAIVVADAVAAPVEQQVDGVDGMTHMTSRCGNDGSYALTVTFKAGTDFDRALALVQARVTLAQPALPEIVLRGGVTVGKKPGDVSVFVVLTSDGSRDTLHLSNYATIHVKDELARLAGVGAVQMFGARDYSLRVWLDPAKLAARGLTAADVARVLEEAKVKVAAGAIGRPPVPAEGGFRLEVLGKREDPASIRDIVVKVDKEGRTTKVHDVAAVELGVARFDCSARYKGAAAVVLGVAPAPKARVAAVNAAVRDRVAKLREDLPPGIRLDAIFDASPKSYLRVDVTLPESASHERTLQVLENCEGLLAGIDGVGATLSIGGHTASNEGFLMVALAPAPPDAGARDRIAAAIRARLSEAIREAVIRLGDPRRPGRLGPEGYALALAVHGGDDTRRLAELARGLVARLQESGKLTDVGVGPGGREAPLVSVDIDRGKVKEMAIASSDLFDALQVGLGSFYVDDFNRFGRTWQVIVGLKDGPRPTVDRINMLTVKTAAGDLVPLGAVATVRETYGPAVVERFNNLPMITLTANPAPGVSATEARALCEAAARDVLRKGHRLGWLHGP
ncbi:MAG: efflux RND transporter permease subunit [Gemmataceae bacterium]